MFNSINELDLNIELFLSNCIEIPDVGKLYCLTNDEIRKIKFTKYNQYLSMLCLEKEQIKTFLNDYLKDEDDISTFEYLVSVSYHDVKFRQLILDALSVFFKGEVIFSMDLLCFIILNSNSIIDSNNYEYIKFILKKQNGIQTEEQEKFANSIAKQMSDKIKAMREKYSKCSNNDDQIYDYSDVLSSISAKHCSINPLNIGQLTVYQTLDQFKRLNKIDKFSIDIQSLLHGAKQENIKLENWFSKIKL